MEDGDCGAPTVPAPLNHDVHVTAGGVLANDRIASSPASDMANYPDVEVSVINNKTSVNNTTSGDSGSVGVTECNNDVVLVVDNKLTTTNSTNSNSDDNNTSDDVKVNGQSDRVHSDEHEDEYTSDEEVLVIDEECKKEEDSVKSTLVTRKRVRSPSPRANFKGFKKRIIAKSVHYRKVVNDLKSVSYYIDLKDGKEVSQQQQQLDIQDQKCCLKATSDTVILPRHKPTTITTDVKPAVARRSTTKRRPSQKLTEYAQYLGLQPAVKFKCVKCSESSFQSLSSLNDHQRHCLSQPLSLAKTNSAVTTTTSGVGGAAPTSTNFRVTRKVFLCSSCGTYYENCNLFLHMREVHRRYICLYCLGMFSLPEKLSHHLVTKHNCSANHYASAEDFLSAYTESCFLVCCQCERVFSERDNFFDHICVEKRTGGEKVCASCGVKGNSGHLPTCKGTSAHLPTCKGTSDIEVPSTSTKSNSNKSGAVVQHKASSKQNKVSKAASSATSSTTKQVLPVVEHVTADSPSTSLLSPAHGPEKDKQDEIQESEATEEMNAAEHFMAAAASSSPENTKEEAETSEEQHTEVTSQETDTAEDTSEAMCVQATSTESEPLPDKTEECEPPQVDKPTENDTEKEVADTTEESKDEDTQKGMSPETTTPTTTVIAEDDTKSQTKPENDEADERKSDKEEPVLSESSDESVVSETNHSEPEENQHPMAEEPKLEESTETNNGSPPPVHSPVDNGEPQDVKDESEDAKESSDHHDEEEEESTKEEEEEPIVQETRKVPKVRLKLPPQSMVYSDNESDDSEKLTMEVDNGGDSDECDSQDKPMNGYEEHSAAAGAEEEYVPVAGEDVPIVELELEQPLDKFTMESLLRRCLGATIPTCVYCNHARKIAVNGKQLALHAIAEHRFAATVNSITAEELIPASFVTRIKECLREVESVYFCLDVAEDKQQQQEEEKLPTVATAVAAVNFKRVYECFQCRYVTSIHKELYLHNRKMHAKTILLCIMCKSNFYSYSELICHLCPGNYVLHSETMFRCCMCSANDLPSAFRLMVHLRKRHHTCDVCLEGCHNQSKLSNHVWKHKLHHLCYRCGIAYRNKPDITKHLFWKHGTESVLCKRCLQKKWPHVYHFCIPPVSFVCEECSHSFTKAVYLKVHKRLHSQEKPHACTEEGCTERFISKKLQLKHEARHREPLPIEEAVDNVKVKEETPMDTEASDAKPPVAEAKPEDAENVQDNAEEPKKSLIDVYDLPALNLSESDSDSEDEKPTTAIKSEQEETKKEDNDIDGGEQKMDVTNSETVPTTLDEDQKPVPILDGIWDNFKNYQATIEKRDGLNVELGSPKEPMEKCEDIKLEVEEECPVPDLEVIMADHDYCLPPEPPQLAEPSEQPKVKTDAESGMDHDYCTMGGKNQETTNNNQAAKPSGEVQLTSDTVVDKKKSKSPKKKSTKHAGSSSSSDSSSDSESSSCTCGSNCSCSSSSGSSSSSSSSSDSDSSSSEGKRRVQARRERRKERAAAKSRKKESETSAAAHVDVVATEDPPAPPLLPVIELPIEESDLDTDETETDEDFYDEHPQRLANKILAEKRNQLALLAAVAPVNNGGVIECSPPNLPEPDAPPAEVTITPPKKKVKAKKRKKKSRSSTPKHEPHNPEYQPSLQLNHRHRHRAPTVAVVVPAPLVQPVVVQSPHIVRVETPKLHQQNQGSGSETDSNVRSSKRRRVPNKFYGYSSDEDAHDKPILKWRKSEITSGSTTVHHVTGSPQFVPPITIKNIPPSPAPVVEPVRAPAVIHHEEEMPDSDSDEEMTPAAARKSSSESSDNSDSDTGQLHISQPPPVPVPVAPPVGYSAAAMAHHQAAAAAAAAGGERSNENLYCYCQCPYDEVSEMIACDGKDCAIEWFHFECVGIMVPPKGKWFCPDCRRKTGGGGGVVPGRSDYLQT